MPFLLVVPLSGTHTGLGITGGGVGWGAPTSPLNRILAWPEGGMSQVLRVYFFGTKRTVNLDKRASSLHTGESGGVFMAPEAHSPYLNPCIPTLYSA